MIAASVIPRPAAVFRRHGDAQPTALGDGLAEFKGKFPGLVLMRPVFVVEPIAHRAHAVTDRLALGRVSGRLKEVLGRRHASHQFRYNV
jgi:hypothetical protein